MSALRYWTVFTVGVAAGTAVALAYAPHEGTKTRKKLKKSFDETSDYLRDSAHDFSKQASQYVSKAQDAAEDFSKQAGRYASQVSDAAESLSKNAGSVANKVASRFS